MEKLTCEEFLWEIAKAGTSISSLVRENVDKVEFIISKSGELKGFEVELEVREDFRFRLRNKINELNSIVEGYLFGCGEFKFFIDEYLKKELLSYIDDVFYEE